MRKFALIILLVASASAREAAKPVERRFFQHQAAGYLKEIPWLAIYDSDNNGFIDAIDVNSVDPNCLIDVNSPLGDGWLLGYDAATGTFEWFDPNSIVSAETDPLWTAWLAGPPNVSVFTNDAGYLTAYSETDPCLVLHNNTFDHNDIADGETAYGWGDHSLVGYLDSSTVLDDLADVNAPSPTDADVLTWDDANSQWIASAAAGGAEIDPCAMPYLDQAVKTTSSPTFADVNLTDNTSLIKVDGSAFLANDGTGNLFLGEDAFNYDSGSGNIGIGYQAGYNNDTSGYIYGSTNIYIGYQAGYGGTPATTNTGVGNVVLGYKGLANNTSGLNNMAIGSNACGKNTSGSDNVGIGTFALYTNTTNSNNTGIGSASLYQTTGANNTAIGGSAGQSLTSGASNIFLGYKAGFRQTTNSNLLIIDNIDRTTAALELANSLIYGVFGAAAANQSLRFNADAITFNGGTNSDIVFTFTGTTKSGSMSWMEDEDYFKFSDDILMATTEKIYFLDTAIGIYSQADTFLDLFADGGVRIGDSSAGAPTNYVKIGATGATTFTGTASLNLPTAAAPTLDAAGELAHDTTVTGLTNGCLSYYDGAAIQYVVDLTTLPSDDDYVVAYDADTDGFYMKEDASGAGGISWSSAPDKPTDSGTAGDVAYDSGNLYVCIATNTWKRTALSTWTNNILLESGDAALLETGDNLLKE